jgi:RNA polymerase sigma factor (sigma-70 family)
MEDWSRVEQAPTIENFYREHARAVYAFCVSLSRDPVWAEDLMQDTFARATRSLGGYRGGNSKSWLFAIARSVFIDDVRKRRPVPTEDIDTAHSTDPDVAEIDVISEALAALPERQRTALLLADPSWTAGGMLGYATCQPPLDDLDDDILGATSAGFSRGSGFLFGDASIDAALDSVVAALTNISGRDELVDYLVEPFDDERDGIREILTELQTDPEVSMVVVTGPSAAIAEHLESEPGVSANVLAVDFYNWTDGICGR